MPYKHKKYKPKPLHKTHQERATAKVLIVNLQQKRLKANFENYTGIDVGAHEQI